MCELDGREVREGAGNGSKKTQLPRRDTVSIQTTATAGQLKRRKNFCTDGKGLRGYRTHQKWEGGRGVQAEPTKRGGVSSKFLEVAGVTGGQNCGINR